MATTIFIAPGYSALSIKHASGETVLDNTPKRVVVLDLTILDDMRLLGLSDDVIGIPAIKMPPYLSLYDSDKYARIGSLFEPNYEKIANLHPDLIIIAGRAQPKFDNLSQIAPTIDLTLANTSYVSDIKRNITLLGQIFDKSAKAKDLIAQLDNTLASVNSAMQNKGKGLLILTTGGKMTAFGPGSRFGLLYNELGVTPVDSHIKISQHGQMISPEYILEENPDWLFVIDRDAAIGHEGKAAAQILDNALVAQTTAAKKGQIIYLNPQNWYLVGGAITGINETAEQLLKAVE